MVYTRLLPLICLLVSSAFGAAYVPGKGKGIAILGVNAYTAKKEFTADRDRKTFGQNGKFTKQELYYYLAYSLRDDLALIASGTAYNSLKYENDFTEFKFEGSGDHFFAGRYFFKKDNSGALAAQFGVTQPLYSKSANPAPGNRQNDLEIRVFRDYFQVMKLSFISWEAAYRLRNSTPSDQLRFDLTFGQSFGKYLLMGHGNFIQGLKNSSGKRSSTNPNTASDFDLLKLGVSVAYRYSEQDAVQLGFMNDTWGRNTGKGNGVFLAWWKGI